MKQLIINTEFFLQCFGHCSGCFLSETERQSKSVYIDGLKEGLETIYKKYENNNIEHLIIGFGRGNILNLDNNNLDELLKIMNWCENNFKYEKLTFEISTSLIGKIEQQIEKAYYLLSKNKSVFFNIVINSEITSLSFWNNLKQFYKSTSEYRIKEFGWKEDWGDIIVLNVNPNNLPNLDFLEEFTKSYQSPINISIFPFEKKDKDISDEEIKELIDWSADLWKRIQHKDLNIKNYLENLYKINLGSQINDILEYQETTEKFYYFIDKNKVISNGSLSIMGEVDKVRLLNKYNLNLDILKAYRVMQKNRACSVCKYQKECLLSGAYLNLMANQQQKLKSTQCLSGYQKLFELSKININ